MDSAVVCIVCYICILVIKRVSGNMLYCVLQSYIGYHGQYGSIIVMVIRGVSPFHALTHASINTRRGI